MEQILKSSQEQGASAWINYLRVLREEALLDKLADQNCNLEKALNALNEIKSFISAPEHILGSFATKHGEVAEHMQVGFSNAEYAVTGKDPIYTFDGVGRLDMEDYLRDGLMVQSKFYNGVKGTFQAVCDHLRDYPDFVVNGGTYDIPKEQYEKLIDIYSRGESARSSLQRSEETLFKAMKAWEAENAIRVKDVIKPSVVGYDDVQLGVAGQTISKEENKVKDIDNEIRQDAIETAKPTVKEGVRTTAVAAILEGGVTFAIKVYQKKKAGVKIQNYTSNDWKEVGLDTLIGTGKGAVRGATVYMMTNFTSVPSPLASAMVTATFGMTAQARKLSKGEISKDDFLDNCEIICLDVAVSALSSMLGELLIPVPILGAIIGNTVGMFMYEISKTYLHTTEQQVISQYQKKCEEYQQLLDNKYQEVLSDIHNELAKYSSLLVLVFDRDVNQRFEASVSLVRSLGTDEAKIIKEKSECDAFFTANVV